MADVPGVGPVRATVRPAVADAFRAATQPRPPRSSAFLPVFKDGNVVPFSTDGVDWPGSGRWGESRIDYPQHSNDPNSWGDAKVVVRKPDWLRTGQRPDNIPTAIMWIPAVTGLQLLLDQAASGIPGGEGHESGHLPMLVWAPILPPENGLTPRHRTAGEPAGAEPACMASTLHRFSASSLSRAQMKIGSPSDSEAFASQMQHRR